MIQKDMSMGRAVMAYDRLLPLLSRFNISLGFGELSVEEVCSRQGVNPDFFLVIVNAYLHAEEGEAGASLSDFPLSDMVAYLQATHTHYVEQALPRLERKMSALLEGSGLSGKEINLLSGFFNDYKEDFLAHISLEEQEILPYILELEKQSLKEKPDREWIARIRENSISAFAQEHDRLEYSLENLSKLIIKYLPPFPDQVFCIEVLRDLAELVQDLADHADMEDKVLIPRVEALEAQLVAGGGEP